MSDNIVYPFRGTEGQIRKAVASLCESQFVLNDLWHSAENIRGGEEAHFVLALIQAMPPDLHEELVDLLRQGQLALNGG